MKKLKLFIKKRIGHIHIYKCEGNMFMFGNLPYYRAVSKRYGYIGDAVTEDELLFIIIREWRKRKLYCPVKRFKMKTYA